MALGAAGLIETDQAASAPLWVLSPGGASGRRLMARSGGQALAGRGAGGGRHQLERPGLVDGGPAVVPMPPVTSTGGSIGVQEVTILLNFRTSSEGSLRWIN